MQKDLSVVIENYIDIIKKFKSRSDVLNGIEIAYKGRADKASFENTPKSIGDGLSTTGWCVSASEALLNDDIFQTYIKFNGIKAKLVSIDIKEQYYGYCFNGSQNKWHTALLVNDSGFNIIIDLTCAQFGNDFVGKDIWDLQTWCDTLRHPFCKHSILEAVDYPSTITPISFNPRENIEIDKISLKDKLHEITSINDAERELLVDFFTNRIHKINKQLIIGNISKNDYAYINKINNLLMMLPFDKFNSGYSVLPFTDKQAAKNWLKLYLEGKGKLPMYLMVSRSVEDSCNFNGIDYKEINLGYKSAFNNSQTYIIFEFSNLYGIDTQWLKYTDLLLPYGIIANYDSDKIYNGGKMIAGNSIGTEGKLLKETNSIYVKIDNLFV